MREHRVDGFLIAPAEGTEAEVVERLLRQNTPVVQMLRRLEKRRGDYVGADFALGMTAAVEHLIALGHKVGGGALHRRATGQMPIEERCHGMA